MDPLELHKLLKNKTYVVNFRMNPKLTKILDKCIKEDEAVSGRSEWFEMMVIRYIQDKKGF